MPGDALSAIAGTLLLAVPAVLAARAAWRPSPGEDPEAAALDRLLVTLGWAIAIVPTLSFLAALATGARVSWWTIAGASAATGGVALLVLRRRASEGPRSGAAASAGRLAAVAVAVALVGLLYFVKYDTRFGTAESCIYTSTLVATGDRDPDADLLRSNIEDARLGNPGVMSAFVVAYGGNGFRVLYGLCGALLALGGFAIGRRAGGGRAWGFAGMAFLALNPYVAAIPQLDENLLTLSLSMTLAPFVAAPAGGWATAGALFGVVVLCRHEMLPAAPALIVAAAVSPARRAVWRLLGAFVAVTALENVHHLLAFGSILRFETYPQYPAFDYTIAGVPFSWHGLVNWPFHDHLVRTPHNPFPMLVAWPLHIAARLGLVLSALVAVGAVAIWRKRPLEAVFWLAWSAVVVAGVAVQEAWDHLNKMGVMAIVFGAVAAWAVAGAAWVWSRPFVGIPVIAALAAAGALGIPSLRDWRAPADERYSVLAPATPEIASRVAADAAKATDAGWLPDLSGLDPHGPVLDVRKPLRALEELASPPAALRRQPWGWFPGEPAPRGAPVVVRIDLGRDPVDGAFLSVTDDEPDVDVSGAGTPWHVRGPDVAWAGGPVDAYAAPGDEVATIAIWIGREGDAGGEDGRARVHDRRKLFSVASGADVRDDAVLAGRDLSRRDLRVRVPAGSMSIVMEKNLRGVRVYLWKAIVSPAGVDVTGPFEPWHN
jgi:hypothetical protein